MEVPKVTTIYLSDYGEINVDTIDGIYEKYIHERIAIAFAESLMNLVNIDCSNCKQLTKEGLEYLIDDILRDFDVMYYSIEFQPTEDPLVKEVVEASFTHYYDNATGSFIKPKVVVINPDNYF